MRGAVVSANSQKKQQKKANFNSLREEFETVTLSTAASIVLCKTLGILLAFKTCLGCIQST